LQKLLVVVGLGVGGQVLFVPDYGCSVVDRRMGVVDLQAGSTTTEAEKDRRMTFVAARPSVGLVSENGLGKQNRF
jgi:hypothetical protein